MKVTKRDAALAAISSSLGFFLPEMASWISEKGIVLLSVFAN